MYGYSIVPKLFMNPDNDQGEDFISTIYLLNLELKLKLLTVHKNLTTI